MSSTETVEAIEAVEKVPEKLTKGKKREKAILQSAIEAFVKYGYSGTTIGKIIETSGGSRSTIYSAYGSKLGLFKAAVENLVLDVYEEYTKVYDPHRPWEEEMVVFGEIYLRDMLKPKVVALTRLIYSEAARFPNISEWAYENSLKLTYLCFAKVLENQIDLPFERLKELSLYYVESLKANLFQHALCDPAFHPEESQIKEEVRQCADIMTVYIKSQISPSP